RYEGGIGESSCPFVFQARGSPCAVASAERYDHRRDHESNGLAAALGTRLLRRCGQEEAEVGSCLREGRWRAHLSDRQDEPGPVMSVQASSSNMPADPAVEVELD